MTGQLNRTNAEAGTFARGSNAGTFTCNVCGKRRQKANREVSTGATTGVCTDCFDIAGDENMVADGHMTCREFLAIYGRHSDYCDCEG